MMVSLRFSIALDKSSYSSKNPNSSPSSIIPFHVGRACVVNSFTRVTHVKSNKPTSEEISLSSLNTESLRSENRINSKKESKRNVGWAGTMVKRNRWERELECLFVDNGDFDVDYSVIRSDLSLELCNSVLKRLGDEKVLRFFNWMRNNEKLDGNKTAYSFIFRVLCRRQDWVLAENLIEESKTQLDYQIFNALIHSCSKLGRADLGAKWFKAMIDRKIEPNAATYGMLMSLYRKCRSVEEAEFTFSHMRAEFPMIATTVRSAYSAMITIYSRLGLHGRAEEVIELVSSDGVRPDSDIWLAMLNAYSQQGKLDEAEAVLVSMRESGFVPNIVAYNTLITGYGKALKIEEARRVFASIGEAGLEPDETSYRSMIEGLGRAGDHDEASRYYRMMKDSGFKPNSSNLFTMMNLQAKHSNEEGMAEILCDMLETGCERASIVGVLVRANERFGRIEKLPSILRGSPWLRSHVMSSQASFSVVVSAYVKHGLVTEAVRVLKEKVWKDPGFEENLYHILICSCKETNRLENAVEIYSQFPKRNKPNIHIACTMIDIFGSMGRFEEAEQVYIELRSSGAALDVVGYTIIVRTFVQSGALDKASAAIDDMEKQTDVISPDVYLLWEMFRLYQRRNDVEKLSRLYHRASAKKESRAGWDKGMYECLINCCARAIPIDEISSLFQEMLRRGFVPNTVTVNVLLHLYGKAKMFRKAKKLFWLAEKWGLVDVVSYNTLISAYGKSNELGKMGSAAKLMSFKGFSVSLEAYTSMLDAYGKGNDMESFRTVLEKMTESGFGSNPYGYNIRINIYGKRGWIDEVAGVLAEMRDCGAQPDVCGYNTLIKAYGIGGMVEEAVGVVKEMRENGVEPDKITYINLITAAKRNDEFLEAVKWSLWMKQMGL